MIKNHQSYIYAVNVINNKISAPKYVKKQCKEFKKNADGKSRKYCIDEAKINLIDNLLGLMIMPSGLRAGEPIYECISGFQFFFIIAVLCTAYRDNLEKRRYQVAILEICRKNGKTLLIAIIFILLMLLEPKFAKLFSVAPDGSLSREIKSAMEEIIKSSPALNDGKKFVIRRDSIQCCITDIKYVPLNYSNSRLDGKLPTVFLIDETGALPNSYAIEAMKSGQLTILNKLGCIISTKYPKINNPFEDEVDYAKKVLDGLVEDETLFALLYEPDDKTHWETNDDILRHSNPLALDIPMIWEDLLGKRERAIEMPSARENFLTKHCNIIYQGVGTESYVDVEDVRKCKVKNISWEGKEVYLGLDLAITTDNCSFSMVAEEDGQIISMSKAFIPEDMIETKNKVEKLNYYEFIREGVCYKCGDRTVDYGFIEDIIMKVEETYGVTVIGIGYDRYNCLSTAQKLERAGYTTVEVKQHSSVLHPPTKLLEELILQKRFKYESNKLLEINFQNARCTFDTNMNRYVNKKKSSGKVDMVVSLLNALFLLQQYVMLSEDMEWSVQVI